MAEGGDLTPISHFDQYRVEAGIERHDVLMRSPPHPSLFPECVALAQCAVHALTDPSSAQAASEHKETALLVVIHLLGRWAQVAAPNNTQWYEHLRGLLDSLPYGLGREAWRFLEQSAGHLLF